MSVVIAAIGAGIFLLLGIGHTVFTLQSSPEGGPMMPTNPDVLSAMNTPSGLGMAPELQATLFKAWRGFNLSHSLGVTVIAAIVLHHAVTDFGDALAQSWFVALVIVVPAAYTALAQQYWFNQPRDAIIAGSILIWVGALIEVL